MQNQFIFIPVFLEGVASFLSPCVLPLIPAYMTYITGKTVESMSRDRESQKTLIMNSLAFILGFTVIFVLLGAGASTLGSFLIRHQHLLRRISGLLIMIFGLFHTGILPIAFLNYEKRLLIRPEKQGLFTSFLVGMGFSIGWTPCIGPILTSVLLLAANTETLVRGMLLLAVYALGLGLPFLLLAVGIRYFWKYLKVISRHMKIIKIVSGIILIIIGIMIYYNLFALLAFY
ncbi:MAG: cytochrome c biogenesis CcdA family protein [Caldicoprobacterales bacterium]